MKKFFLAVLAATVTIMAGASIAPIEPKPIPEPCVEFVPSTYIGISGNFGAVDLSNINTLVLSEDNVGLQGQIGYNWFGTEYARLAVEARLGGISFDSLDVTYLTGYLKPEILVNKALGIYGLVGYGVTDISVSRPISGGTLTYDVDVDDFTYGAGIRYTYSTEIDIVADYVVLPNFQEGNTNIDADLLTIGINYNF